MASVFYTVPRFGNYLNEYSRPNKRQKMTTYSSKRTQGSGSAPNKIQKLYEPPFNQPVGPMDISRNSPGILSSRGYPSRGGPVKMSNRRRRSRRRRRGGRRRRITRVPTLWPRRHLVKFKLCHFGSLTHASGLAVLAIKANSLADPFGASGVELPLGLDQWAALYSQYTVVSSKLIVQAHSTSDAGLLAYGISLMPGSTTLATADYYREKPMTAMKVLTADMDHSGLAMKYRGKRYEHVRKWADAENFQAPLSVTPGDPIKIRYFHLFCQDVSGANAATIEYVATLEFVCLLFDPIIPARSSL